MSQRYIGGLIYNPPGGFSGYLDGSGDYLSAPDNAAWYFTGDFTVECWAYWSSVSSSEANVLAQHRPASAANQAIEFWSNATTLYLAYSSSSVTTTIAANQWYHLAMSCTSGTASCYVNGVRIGTFSMPTRIDSADPFTIGARTGSGGSGATGFFTGYISNVRVINGTGIYSGASFDPPVGPLQAITNTSLLTCAYPTFRDGSSNNFTITVNGNTAVSTQNPFPQTQLPNPALGNQGNGVYSMSQYQALKQQNLWPAIDPYFDYVTMMLHGNGTNGAQNNTFLDSSTNNFTITRNGNTTQGTFTPYGANWSNYFDGSGDYLSIPSSAGLRFDGQFCVEGWVNFNAFNTQNFLISQFTASGEAGWIIRYTGTALRLYAQNGAVTIDRTWSPSRGVWYHFAVTRDSSNDIRFFIDGTQLGATATGVSTTMSSTNTAYIGGHPDIANDTNAYLSNMRVVKGSAVYTSNFTPSTAPLTAITNTSLLTCQSNRFIDNSSNNFTITRNGDVSVQRFSPFNPTAPYAAGTIGGSGYFDGSGDYLSATNSGAFDMNTSFTAEAWVYQTASGATGGVMGVGGGAANWSTSNGHEWLLLSNYSGTLYFQYNAGGSPGQITATGAPLNQWNHIAVGYNGTTASVWLNGTRVGTASISVTLPTTRNIFTTGNIAALDAPMTGYISSARVVRGTDVYGVSNSTITVPTAPLTAITNTSLLLNFTNAGIIDNAMMNDLETVGNAQISTSVSKFGGGSLAFDGTGDYLVSRAPTNNLYAFGTGDFTIEFWLYLNSTGQQIIWDGRPGSTTPTIYYFNSALRYYTNGADQIVGSSLATGQWYHIAISRSGTSTRMFINGTQSGSTYSDSTNYTTSTPIIGADANSGSFNNNLNGYIDDLRITKYARYTTSFTPQRSQWQDQ